MICDWKCLEQEVFRISVLRNMQYLEHEIKFCLFIVGDKVTLCCAGSPGTHYVDEAALPEICLLLPPVWWS